MAQTKLTAEQRAALINSLEAAFTHVGGSLYEIAPKLAALLEKYGAFLCAAQSREALDTALAAWEVEDVEQIRNGVMLFAAAPGLVDTFLNDTVRAQAAALPALTGAPVKTDINTRRQVIQFIAGLYAKQVRVGDAQTRAAQKFHISKRSVQRIWHQRGQFAEQPFQTIEDLWEFLKPWST